MLLHLYSDHGRGGQGDDHELARLISRLLGWTYFSLWALSFYPQPLHHIRRRSTRGFSLDFTVANLVGLTCYGVANAMLLYSPEVRQEYAARHPGAPRPPVAFNDLAYAVHGVVLVLIVLTQFVPRIWGFDVGSKARPSGAMLAICATSMSVAVASAAAVGVTPPQWWPWPARGRGGGAPWAWLDVADTLSTVKVLLTAIKYTPQAWTNYRLQSTAGFNVVAVVMDVVGALLSLLQLLIDATVVEGGGWADVTANPGKFGLGNVSLAYDAVFLWQHFVLYRAPRAAKEERLGAGDGGEAGGAEETSSAADEQTPLLLPPGSRA